MAKSKFDFVVEAAHYSPEGNLVWVRGYERRGPTFSDRVLLHRDELVQRMKSGQRFVYGRRISLMAGTFEVEGQLKLYTRDGGEVVATVENHVETDTLSGVPIL